jgi:Putative transposase/Transposase zinc-binding domain
VCDPPQRAGAGVELASIVRSAVPSYTHEHRICGQQQRALTAIARCRTQAMGATVSRCDRCGEVEVRYHSCRNRHCPKCQTLAKERWLAARTAELLSVPYFHVVFTVPHALNPLAQGYPRLMYSLLFGSAAATLETLAADPKWLGAELGVTMILHTWSQTLEQHLHVHCLITAGGLSAQGQWRACKPHFLFPVRALSRMFCGKLLSGLSQAYAGGNLHLTGRQTPRAEPDAFADLLRSLRAQEWVVYAKQPFAGPKHVLAYLARYTHRIAISNERLVSFDEERVRFRYRDRRRGNRSRAMTLERDEFLRRFLLHVLPQGFMRIRHFGLFANRTRAEKLARARTALHQPAPEPRPAESAPDFMRRVAGIDLLRCPRCRTGRLQILCVAAPAWRAARYTTGPPP